ncbi:phosphatidylglycerophosphatase A [Enterovibrio nigricans]|uniref:Phosphatidylglycerophosphatase A n=1 Tax=Enterovibrio nigricans DSM 22720 TaxID=1121868 RepID=A0A1T4U384_9GAMM|nr:phosphatidylglycerophosphatase A [Enterovibrio nigricans]PKF51802.1 phosphatidylglycerophosphatase A [Enterovibrio nigricans]SKA47070.1 phosphatidylglycerophosphatase A [Enterovibrio nigricans DSM 22720]
MNNPISKIRLSNPIHLLATGFGSGLSPIVPGTMGTLAAVPFYLLIVALSPTLLPVAIIVGAAVGIYLCGRTSEDMGVHDHGSIVWDEFVGFWITMLLVPVMEWQTVLAGFVIFRFFDMVKPWPISWLDKKVHGGLGIMLDDIVAGLMSMIVLWAGHHYLSWW